MKVKDLIRELEKHDPEHLVCVEGYEGGLTEIISLHIRAIKLYSTASDLLHCYDEHEEIRFPEPGDERTLLITRDAY